MHWPRWDARKAFIYIEEKSEAQCLVCFLRASPTDARGKYPLFTARGDISSAPADAVKSCARDDASRVLAKVVHATVYILSHV